MISVSRSYLQNGPKNINRIGGRCTSSLPLSSSSSAAGRWASSMSTSPSFNSFLLPIFVSGGYFLGRFKGELGMRKIPEMERPDDKVWGNEIKVAPRPISPSPSLIFFWLYRRTAAASFFPYRLVGTSHVHFTHSIQLQKNFILQIWLQVLSSFKFMFLPELQPWPPMARQDVRYDPRAGPRLIEVL